MMPADKHTKKANTPAKKRQWQHVRESAEKKGKSEGSAIRQANAVVRDTPTKKKR
jgi:hypothetical protein